MQPYQNRNGMCSRAEWGNQSSKKWREKRRLRKTGQGVDEWCVFRSLGIYPGRKCRPHRSITESSEQQSETLLRLWTKVSRFLFSFAWWHSSVVLSKLSCTVSFSSHWRSFKAKIATQWHCYNSTPVRVTDLWRFSRCVAAWKVFEINKRVEIL